MIVATGSTYSKGGRTMTLDADIPGHDRPFVYRPEDILMGGVRPTGNVVLLDGEGAHASTGMAEMLAGQGAGILYVTAGFSPVSSRLTDSHEARFVVQRMKAAGVRFAPATWVRSIGDGTITLYDVHSGEDRSEAVDAVILSCGRVPQDGIARALEGRVSQLFTVGDALAARPWAAAAYEGHRFARLIGEPGAPTTICETIFRPDPIEVHPVPANVAR